MAEFKLGRIRFVWKGNWAAATTYYKDDVIRNGGKTYICTIGHTSASDFYNDAEATPARWNQLSDGQAWTGDWDTSSFYRENDIVKYGGNLYICIDSHTSASLSTDGLEANISDWELFAEGLDWKGNWATSTRYKVNDLVKYGGITYVCNTQHSSAATTTLGLENDQSKWDEFNKGIDYKGDWSGSAVRYKINDVVKLGGTLWICQTYHTSTAVFSDDESNWAIFIDGFKFQSDWGVSTVYKPGDIVRYGGNQYLSKTNHVGANPSTSTVNWDLFAEGFRFADEWNISTTYRKGNVVTVGGNSYLSIADSVGFHPTNTSYWSPLTKGIRWRDQWVDDSDYEIGDVVRYGTNSFICIQRHRAEGDDASTIGPEGGGAANSRPDQDINGVYWNAFALGSDTSVLTTEGDLVYFGGAGPARLPIGREGQFLRAGSRFPEWVSFGELDHTYFVGPNGEDSPSPLWGRTFDKPWKTIRYACEQVENGPRNPNAKRLLELNRVFIQREVSEWIEAQVNLGTGIWNSFDFDEYKCERDTGFIVDALIYDISHGGNVKTRGAANSYVGGLSESETIPYGVGLANEAPQSVAALNYMLTVVSAVLNQTSPAVNYQVTNGDNSTAIVAQTFELGIEAEAGVFTTISSLVKIITDAITAGDADDIPERYSPTNLINVATGRFREVLPIIVPEQTCVKGDELRSTNAGPGTGTTLIEDSKYSLGSLGRLEQIVDAIIEGSSVTPSTGVTEIQDIAFPFSNSQDSITTTQLVRVMQQNIDFRLGTLHLVESIDPTGGSNNAFDSGFADARKLIKENKKYFQEETVSFITANFPTVKYSKTICKRDVGYIVDAIVYDLTYGGNSQSVAAGSAYFEGATLLIDSSEKAATLSAYEFLKSRMQNVALNNLIASLQNTIPQYRDTAGSSTASTAIGNNLDTIISIINTGVVPTATDPSTSWVDAGKLSNNTTISTNAATFVSNVTSYIATNFPDLDYDTAKCERDVGIIIKAVRYDYMFDSNFQTTKAAYAYLRSNAGDVYTLGQKTATRASFAYLKTLIVAAAPGTSSKMNSLFTTLDDIIYMGSVEGSRCATDRRSLDYAVLQLERNRDFIVDEINAYIGTTYTGTISNTNATGNVITIDDTSWLQRNASIQFTGTMFGGLSSGIQYFVQKIISDTEFAVATTRFASDAQRATLTTASGSATVSLFYSQELCQRDVNAYIDSLKYDLKYPGNYKSLFAARYYANSVLGSLEEDMFYLRDATGLRDMTLEGLTGDLLASNQFGTSRVSAGAYASLDPGWGPEDYRTWIIDRSPYVQGVTTIGTACIGQKIDGALHNGGNDSIVSNDFTQVLSDGIGAWVENNGRAELVSVFTYYCHIGYLSTNGGRIRGTNGNCSYGDFGAVAEGFDSSETANTAVIDNKFSFKATIANVYTNGSAMLAFEFENAGEDYTSVSYNLLGGGVGASVIDDEFRDDGVHQVRLLDLGDDSSGQLGGSGFLTSSGTAQGGSSTSITISATDSQLSTAYVGMKIYLTGGTGGGQYGIISSYNVGTKVANVVKESTGVAGWDHAVVGTTIASPDASTTYTIEPAVSFTSPAFNAASGSMPSSGVWTSAVFGKVSTTYTGVSGTYSGSGASGALFTVVRNGWRYVPRIQTGGAGYARLETITIAGTALGGTSPTNDLVITITSINSTTGEILDFDFTGFSSNGRFVAVKTGGTDKAAYSNDGISWTESTLPSSGDWTAVTSGTAQDGSSEQAVDIFVAVRSGSNLAAYSTDGINWSQSTMPATADWSSVAFGNGKFVAVSSGSTDVAISLDGIIWDISANNSQPSDEITYGRGIFAAIKAGTNVVTTSADGESWADRALPATRTWTSIAFGINIFVVVASDSNTGAFSINGTTWADLDLGSADSSVSGLQQVRYGQGLFMATTYLNTVEDYSFVMTSEDGINWTSRGLPAPANSMSGYNAIAFGSPSRKGRWVVVGNDSGDFVVNIRTGTKARARASVADEKIFIIKILEPGSGYDSVPTMTVTDPNNTYEVPHTVRLSKGALANPTFFLRGSGYVTGSAEVDQGDGYADNFQPGSFVAVRRITQRPIPGSNVAFANLPNRNFKLVNVVTFLGTTDGSYTAFYQISPALSIAEAPEHLVGVTTRLRYSQVRLTGHDFLDIGTGNLDETNYPGEPDNDPIPANETVESNGGRVFFTATDQDGNFRVGTLFSIEQSTGVATLNADAFNISGLQELNLGNVTLGGGSATVTEFSTDPFFTANSDNIVPTQRAIKAYIANQIGGGGAALNVNSVTAGSIVISSNVISTTTTVPIKMRATFEFRSGITGIPLAFNYFLI